MTRRAVASKPGTHYGNDNENTVSRVVVLLWLWFSPCFSFGLVGSFINYFYTDVLGISALAANAIFLIARAWDAVHDPLFASIMDTINSRFRQVSPLFTDRPAADHRGHPAGVLKSKRT